MLHSHASRQIKQQAQFGLSPDIVDMLKAKREEMLQLAEQCFTSASQCERGGEEEQWLHHYMLGKINEKMGRSVYISLEHYRIAAEHLHENDARYPRKITYHNPPELSIESLEVYYRLHASILKFLMKHENKELPENAAETFQKYLKGAAEGPFANFQEKSRYSSLSSSDVEDPTPPPPGETSEKYTLPCVIYDHDYFRRKQKDSSAEESETDPFVRRSVDSSSESLDSATVKDILNSIVSVVSEKCAPSEDANQNVPGLVVLGDMKIKKMVSMIKAPKDKIEKIPDAPVTTTKPNDTVQFNTPYTSTVDSTTPEVSQSGTSAPVSRSDSVTEDSDIEIISASIKSDTLMKQVQELEKDITKEKGEIIDNSTQSSVSSTTAETKPSTVESSVKIESGKNNEAEAVKPETKKENEPDTNTSMQTIIGKTEEKVEHEKATEQLLDHNELIFQCLAAMKLCLQRFPQHYKSLYLISYYHCYSKYHKNLQWSRDYLLGNSSIPWQNLSHMPSQGLFSERKNTNFFNGIWRIPNDDIDRPGSFGSHMFRSVLLVLEVLKQMKDYNLLVHLTIQMHRNPDIGKKFLRDVDRLYLAGKSLSVTLQTLKDELERLCSCDPSVKCQQKIIQHLLIIYRAWHNLLKSINKTEEINGLLEDSYRKVKNLEGDSSAGVSLLDQAIRFCQQKQQLAKLSQSPHRAEVSKLPHPVSSTVTTMLPSQAPTLEDDLNANKIVSHQETPQENEAYVGERSISGETYATKRDAKSYESYSDLLKKDNSSSGKLDSSQMTQAGLVETGHSKGKQNGNKPGWANNSIPASGMVIGSMTIMPVMSNQPSNAEGLMGRLVSAQPRLPQNTMPAKRSSTSLPKTPPQTKPNINTSQPFSSFDPSRLTADVQSKITSLDPLEPSKQQQQQQQTSMSGFQMEFLRQLAQKQPPSPKVPRSPVGHNAKVPTGSHQAWGSRGPVAAPPPAVPVSSNNQTKSPATVTKTLPSPVVAPPSSVPASNNQNKLFPSSSKTSHSGAVVTSSDKPTGASVPANSDNQTKPLISFPKSNPSPIAASSSTVPVNTNNQSKIPANVSDTSLSAFPSSDVGLVSTPLRVISSSLPATSSKSSLSSPPPTSVLPTKVTGASNEPANLLSIGKSGSISQDSLSSPVTSPSSPDKQIGCSSSSKSFSALRSIRIPSITQEPARKMAPPTISKTSLSSKASTLGLKPLLDTDIEVITLVSSSSQEELE